MADVVIITEQARTVNGAVEGGRVLVDAATLPDALGWELKPEGLCRGDTCVPVRDVSALTVGPRLDVAAVAAALGRSAVVDADAGVAAVSLPAERRHQALDALEAPRFVLPDLHGVDHGLDEWRGTKKLLLAFASW